MRLGLHGHFVHTWEKGKLGLDRVLRTPEAILDRMRETGLDGYTLTDYADKRFWKFHDACPREGGRVGKYSVVKRLGNAVVFADDIGELQVCRGYEVESREGHVFLFGLNKDVSVPYGLPLPEILSKGRELGAVMWPDHPFGPYGIGEKNIRLFREYFSTFEAENCNYPDKDKAIRQIERNTGLKGIAVSDEHNPKDMGNAYILLLNKVIDFGNEDKIRDSLKDRLEGGFFIPKTVRKNSFFSKVGHVIACQYDIQVRKRFGLLPQP